VTREKRDHVQLISGLRINMKRPLINIISFAGYYLKIWHVAFWLYKLVRKKPILVVFTYHRITNSESTNSFLVEYDVGLDKNIFDEQLSAIGEYFDVVGLDDFINVMYGRKELSRHSALLTFDDADIEFIQNGTPYLLKRNWKCVVFTPVGHVECGDRFWHLRVSNVFMKLDNILWERIFLQSQQFPTQVQKVIQQYKEFSQVPISVICKDIIHVLDMCNDKEILSVIEALESIVGKDDILGIKCMDWNQLRSLLNMGFSVESHTMGHFKLSRLDSQSIETELDKSKSFLENKLNCEVKAICYPQGSYNEQVISKSIEIGYQVGFSTEQGTCQYPIKGADLYKIPRLSLEASNKYKTYLSLGLIAVRGIISR
jgi:peptidoglycan/xylan/chitin deacetylase (PgdA/CDA1 family)